MIQKIETNLIQSIASSEIKNITEDVCELGLDAIIDEGILKDIPVFGTLTKLFSVGATIYNKIFEKKILKFFYELDKISLEKRTDFVEQLNCDHKFKQRVGEHLLILLDRLDDMNKPQILARIFSALINKKIDFEMFVRLSSVVDKILISDLNKLRDFQNSQFASFTATSLQNVGLVYKSLNAPTKFDENGNQTGGTLFLITELGEILIDNIKKLKAEFKLQMQLLS